MPGSAFANVSAFGYLSSKQTSQRYGTATKYTATVIGKANTTLHNLKASIMTELDQKKLDKEEIENFIEMIKSFDATDSYFSYPFIKNAISEILFPVPTCTIPKGEKLVRGRVHKDGEQFYSKISDISYNRQTFLIKDFGRTNEPCQSMFYCSDNPITALNETCTILREDLDKDFELITWGIWEVTRDIKISYIIGHPSETTENETLKKLTKSFGEFLNKMPEDQQTILLLLHDFVSQQFQINSKGHHALYKISCAYSNWVYDQKFIDIDNNSIDIAGIMYRSAIWPKEGMNIALKDSVVDTSLRLMGVRRDHIVRKGDFYDGSNTIRPKSIDIENDTIFWT